LENDRYILRSITDEIMYEIMRLSGQEYVDMYASRAKDEQKRLDREAAREASKKAAGDGTAAAGSGEGTELKAS
ncbi:MAG TPA: 1-acyl-sn-glycerol-3-phosphate acyltransferase, partial [Nocardioidaceae bacterium]|nr:1-acyl-sn-glycerol-3-phosphate acyltransferase [Nocardioidaceae bacterium]